LGKIHVFGNVFGDFISFLGKIQKPRKENVNMRKRNYKGRCEKKSLSKSAEVVRTYDAIQSIYVDILQSREDIAEIKCNVPIIVADEEYMSDFVCRKVDGELMVRECVFRKYLMKPMTVRLLDISREYWLKQNVNDWGIVIDEEKQSFKA